MENYLKETGTSLEIVINSHLSDAAMETSWNPEQAQTRIKFVKYLINKSKGNLNVRVDIDALWNDFKKEWLTKTEA